MFGGEIGLINNRADGSHGIGTSDWPPRGSLDDPNRRIWHTVSMEYIERMFQMETWQRDFDLKHWRVFNIERDGAASSTSTLSPQCHGTKSKELRMKNLPNS